MQPVLDARTPIGNFFLTVLFIDIEILAGNPTQEGKNDLLPSIIVIKTSLKRRLSVV
jgi:hypothetical protein